VKANGESVTIRIEYQWLPPKCSVCNVFGHKCTPKITTAAVDAEESWHTVGNQVNISNKDPIIQQQVQKALEVGGSTTLDAVTREVVPSSPLHKNGITLPPAANKGVEPLGIIVTGEDTVSSEDIDEIIADACPSNMGFPSTTGTFDGEPPKLNSPAGLFSHVASSPSPTCPQSAGTNTKKNKNKKKGSNGRSNSSRGH